MNSTRIDLPMPNTDGLGVTEQRLVADRERSFTALALYVEAHLRDDMTGSPGTLERIAELRAEHIANCVALDEYRAQVAETSDMRWEESCLS